jgi:transcriptional regulator with XRE-family HTH domain
MYMFLRLRDVREDCDKTQAQVAEMLGCKQQTYSRYENEKAQMPYQTLCQLADYFNTSVDYLLGRTDEQRPYPPGRRKPL